MVKEVENKRGQVTIWIIVALAIVVGFLILFSFKKIPILGVSEEIVPTSYIDKCVRQAVNEATDKLLPRGGFLDPVNTKEYNRVNVSYLCENINYYLPCVNEHPMLIKEIKNEIHNYTSPRIEQCFADLKSELEKRQNKVEYGPTKFEVSLAPSKVFVNIDKRVSITRESETRTLNKFSIELLNPVYDLANIAIEIANNNAKYCYFEYVGYMILYPRWKIEVFSFSEGTRIYTITDKNSDKKMSVAIRGCAIPPGI